jgi:hypothetical protein
MPDIDDQLSRSQSRESKASCGHAMSLETVDLGGGEAGGPLVLIDDGLTQNS